MNEKEMKEILSRAQYWNEVKSRPDGRDILADELREMIREHGLKILWWLEGFAKVAEVNK